ncbi:MAG TPA: helix-turn-helix domain-containing protein [Spirochaetota bacterium]|nr:helix-turn-helix domain-containing protein [Spirochaetota bacterium]
MKKITGPSMLIMEKYFPRVFCGPAIVLAVILFFCVGGMPVPVLGEVVVSQTEKETSLEGPWKINLHDSITFAAPEYDDSSWDNFNLPGSMMRYALERTGTVAGTLWIRKIITVDPKYPREDIGLILGRIGNADETYFNGVRIGSTGRFPPRELSMWNHPRHYAVPVSAVRYGAKNVIAVRIRYYMFNEVRGPLAVSAMEEFRSSKATMGFLLITMDYLIIAAGVPIFLVFFFFYIRRRSSEEYLFYCLQLLCGLVVILELCNYWNSYGSILARFKILGVGWAALNVVHPIFLHRIYGMQRKKIEKILWIYLAVVIFMAAVFTNMETLRIHGILMIAVTVGIGFYNFSCHFSALYKKSPYAKLFGFFGSAVVITAIHDGFIYLFKFTGYDFHYGILFDYMLFPYGAFLLYTGTTLVLVSRLIGMMDEIEDLNTSLESFVIEKALLSDRLSQSQKKTPPLSITSRTEEKIRKVKEFIEENYTSDISREGLAASVEVHPDNLGKLFKTCTNQKLGDYIYELRVRDAAKKLLETDDNIIDIAFSVGFESLRTFNRIFPKFMGTTPEKFRRQNRQ